MNINFAICRLLDRSVNSVPEIYMTFYEFMKDHFFKNYDKLNAIIDKNIHINKLYYVRIYEMSTQANYVALKNLLEKNKDRLNDYEELIKELDVNDIINKLNVDENYFNDYNIDYISKFH